MHKAGMFISEQLRHELQQRSYLIQASLPVAVLAGWLAAGCVRPGQLAQLACKHASRRLPRPWLLSTRR
jgi:hypothetical protein